MISITYITREKMLKFTLLALTLACVAASAGAEEAEVEGKFANRLCLRFTDQMLSMHDKWSAALYFCFSHQMKGKKNIYPRVDFHSFVGLHR